MPAVPFQVLPVESIDGSTAYEVRLTDNTDNCAVVATFGGGTPDAALAYAGAAALCDKLNMLVERYDDAFLCCSVGRVL